MHSVQICTPDSRETYRLDCSDWEAIGDGDFVASGTVSWNPSTTAPSSVGTPTATGTDQFLDCSITGFTANVDYYAKFKVTSTSGAVEDFFVLFTCIQPDGF